MLWKCFTKYVSKFEKVSSGHRIGKCQFSFQSQRKAIPKNAQITAQLHSSHTLVKKCSKFSKRGFSNTWTAYLRLLILLLAILIPACVSASPAFLMVYSAYKLNKQHDNTQPWCTPFPLWNQSVVPCPVLTVASWPAYRLLDENILMAESEEKLKNLLIKVKQENEKVGIKLNIHKTKIMASGPITSWQIVGETVADFIFLGSKITADGDCNHEIKRCLLLGRKVMTT